MASNSQENGNQEYLAHFKAISSFVDKFDLKDKERSKLYVQEFLEAILSLERQRLREYEARKIRRRVKEREKMELYRQYVALAAMIPFALLMATELASVYSESVLLGTISAGLSHALLPFAVLSLICTLYLIYNNRKIAQKKRELENVESGREEDREEEQKFRAPDITESLNYVEVLAAILVIASEVLSEALPLEAAEDILLFIANAISFIVAYCNYNNSEKKEVGEDNDKLGKKEGNSFNTAYRNDNDSEKKEVGKDNDNKPSKNGGNSLVSGLMLAGSAILLLKRVLLLLVPSLSPAAGPILGFIGSAVLILGSGLAVHFYRKQLTDVEVSGHKNPYSNIITTPQMP